MARWPAALFLVACRPGEPLPDASRQAPVAEVAPIEASALLEAAAPVEAAALPAARALPSRERLAASLRGVRARGFLAMTGGTERAYVPVQGEMPSDRPVLVASFTKLWVAIAVLGLAAEGKLSLDDAIRDLVPELRSKPWSDSTIRELLGHVSRVPELDDTLYSDPAIDFTHPAATLARCLSAATEKRGVWKYRNAEFAILGAVLEARGGAPAAEVLAKRIFEPAKMTHAGLLVKRGPSDLDLSAMGLIRPQNFFTAGAGYASGSDLLAFFEALDRNVLLDPASRATLFTSTAAGNALGCWAHSFAVADGGTTTLVERPGSFVNVRLFTAFFPEEHRAIVLWSDAPVEIGRPRTPRSLASKLAHLAIE